MPVNKKLPDDANPDVPDEKTVVQQSKESVDRHHGVEPGDFAATQNDLAPYAVDGNDVTGFENVSQEYRTYANVGDAPVNADGDLPSEPEDGQPVVTPTEGVDPATGQEKVEEDEESDDDNQENGGSPSSTPPIQ